MKRSTLLKNQEGRMLQEGSLEAQIQE